MLKQYIPSIAVLLLVVGCSSSHTDKIKSEMKDKFNQQVYLDLGGEKDSKERYNKYCESLKNKRINATQIKIKLLTHRPSFTNDQINLGNAEINLAAKDCK